MMLLMHLDLHGVLRLLFLPWGFWWTIRWWPTDAISATWTWASRGIAAWLGSTKLARAIPTHHHQLHRYLPSCCSKATPAVPLRMPVVIAASVGASRLASLTFHPFSRTYLLNPSLLRSVRTREARTKGFLRILLPVGGFLIDHRYWVRPCRLAVAGGFYLQTKL
jgi:hypothetical protein